MLRLALIIAITTALAPVSFAQRETPSAVGAPPFVSIEGQFSISLPKPSGVGPLTIPTPFGNAKGAIYRWQTKEATFGVGYAVASQPLDDPDNVKQFLNGAVELFKKLAKENSGTVAAVRQITLDKYPGIEQRADLFTGSIIQRTYIASRRVYETIAVVKNSQREFETVAAGVLDSFKLLSDAEPREPDLRFHDHLLLNLCFRDQRFPEKMTTERQRHRARIWINVDFPASRE